MERRRSRARRRDPAGDDGAPRALPRPVARETPAARLAAAHGARALGVRAALLGRRVLLPDPEVAWLPDALRAGVRIVREREIDVVLSTSPPNSVHVIAAAIARRAGVPLRRRLPRLVAREPAPALRAAQRARQARGRGAHRARARSARRRDQRRHARSIAEEAAALAPPGTPSASSPNGCDFDEFDGLAYAPRRAHAHRARGLVLRPAHAAAVPEALARAVRERPELRGRVQARFLGELRPADREWALGLGLGDALALEGFRPHAEAIAAMRAADVLLLLVPRAGGRGLSSSRARSTSTSPPSGPIARARAARGRRRGAAARHRLGLDRRPGRRGRDRAPRSARPSPLGRPVGWASGGSRPTGASGWIAARAPVSWRSCCASVAAGAQPSLKTR